MLSRRPFFRRLRRMALHSLWRDLKIASSWEWYVVPTRRCITSQRCSIGFKSRLALGQSRTLVLLILTATCVLDCCCIESTNQAALCRTHSRELWPIHWRVIFQKFLSNKNHSCLYLDQRTGTAAQKAAPQHITLPRPCLYWVFCSWDDE